MAIQKKSQSNRQFIAGLLVFSILFCVGCASTFISNSTAEPTRNNTTFTPTLLESAEPTHTLSPTETPSPTGPSIYYVAKNGSNAGGKSWETAWRELDQIQWEQVNPGDTIIIAGGEYHTSLNVGKSGAPDQPITITTNGEQVVLDGQRSAPPFCGETGYTPQAGNDAINLENRSFIIIDGQAWSGIIARNHKRGIMMRRGASHITVRYMEIYANGWTVDWGPGLAPDGPGVELGGSDVLFERVIIHDNGQDAFQAGWGVWNFTLRDSWLYNSREHPTDHGQPFNYCSHTDAIQIYDAGVQGPMVIENSIIGPSFTQGIMINNKAAVNDVLIKNTLFVSNGNAGIAIQNDGESSNWTLQNVTVVQDVTYKSWNIKMKGSNHQIKDSIFWGGPWGIGVYNWSEASGNYYWLTKDEFKVADELDPMFLDDDYSAFQGTNFADFDFKVQNPAIPSDTGSLLTSVKQLLSSR